MIRDYLFYRKKGLGPLKSFKLAWPRPSTLEKLCVILAVLAFVWLGLFTILHEYQDRHDKLVLSAHISALERNLEAAKVERLEAVFIGCLNNEPIRVNGRSMNCSVREHREAVDI
jgi:hypothetical protein